MPDYQKMYSVMFNAATDAHIRLSCALEALEKRNAEALDCDEMFIMLDSVREGLKEAQKRCEGLYILDIKNSPHFQHGYIRDRL